MKDDAPWFEDPEHCDNVPEPSAPGSSFLARLEAATLTTEQLKALPPPKYLIQGLIPSNAITVLYGAPGEYKSFVAICMALHVRAGSWWHGREVVAGPVAYVIAESPDGAGLRVDAHDRHYGIYDSAKHHPIDWCTLPPNLADAVWTAAFVEYCTIRKPVMVVIDTLARCIVGAEENSARDMGVIVENAERIRRATGAAVVIVHHTGKDKGQGARGSNSLRGAAAAEIECSAVEGKVTLRVRKQKDGREVAPIKLARHIVDLGTDDKGQPVTSLVLLPDRGQDDTAAGELTENGRTALDALRSIEVPGGIATSVWLESCEDLKKRTFYDQRARLVDLGLVVNVGTERAPKYITAERLEQDADHD